MCIQGKPHPQEQAVKGPVRTFDNERQQLLVSLREGAAPRQPAHALQQLPGLAGAPPPLSAAVSLTWTVGLVPGMSLPLIFMIWLRRMRGSLGGVVSLKFVCKAGKDAQAQAGWLQTGRGTAHINMLARRLPMRS